MAYSRQQVDSFVPSGSEVLFREPLPETVREPVATPLQTLVQIQPILLGGRPVRLPEMWQATVNPYALQPDVYQLTPTDQSQYRAKLTLLDKTDALLWLPFHRRDAQRPVAYELTERPEEQVQIFTLARPPREKRLSIRGL